VNKIYEAIPINFVAER